VSGEQANDEDSELSELTGEQLHAEYVISQETLAYHKEQVGHVSSQLHELTLKLVEKKKERDVHVAHYDSIRDEFTRRKEIRKATHHSQRCHVGLGQIVNVIETAYISDILEYRIFDM